MATVSLKNIYKIYPNTEKKKKTNLRVTDEGVLAVDNFCLDIKDKEFIVLVGPSGCGKSTTLRMVAGLEEITKGELYIDNELVNDVAPKDRDIAMVFQSYALYPHLTVRGNMEFPLKLKKMPKEEMDKAVENAARILDLTEYLDRKPKALSGGQRQRVAIGRAIVRNPKILLMDEPLSNLDAKLRNQMRAEIIKLRQKIDATFIYVTHDQTEALTLADRIVCMSMGHVQQIGTPLELYDTPANLFVAGFIGLPPMNFLDVTVSKGRLEGKGYAIPLSDGDRKLLSSYEGKEIVLGVRPENVVLGNDVPVKVFSNENLGMNTLVHGNILVDGKKGAKLTGKLRGWCNYKLGDEIKVSFDRMHFFDKETTNAIREGK